MVQIRLATYTSRRCAVGPAGGCFQSSALVPGTSWRFKERADVIDFEERDRGLRLSVGVEDLPNVSIALGQ